MTFYDIIEKYKFSKYNTFETMIPFCPFSALKRHEYDFALDDGKCPLKLYFTFIKIDVREYRRGNQKRAIQRNWQYRVHKTKTNKTKTQNKQK